MQTRRSPAVLVGLAVSLSGFLLVTALATTSARRTTIRHEATSGAPVPMSATHEITLGAPSSLALAASKTETRQDDGSFEATFVVQDTAGTSDYLFIRYPSSILPAPPYLISGMEIHGNDVGTSTPFAEAGIVLGDPLPSCPDPGSPVLKFDSPAFPSTGGALDSIPLCSASGYYVSSATDVWLYVQFPPGVTISEQPAVASDDSNPAASNSYATMNPAATCGQTTGQTFGMRLLTSDAPALGMIGMWSGALDSIPDDWVQLDFMADRLAYGTDTGEEPGATGDGMHTHTINPPGTTSGNDNGNATNRNATVGAQTSDSPHTHNINIPAFQSEPSLANPVRVRFAFISKDTLDVVPAGLVAIWADSLAKIPPGWNPPSFEVGGVNFFVAGTRPGEAPGSFGVPSHSHDVNPPAADTGGPSATINRRGTNVQNQAGPNHTHTLNIPTFASENASVEPPYHTVVFIEAAAPAAAPPGLIVMWGGPLAAIPSGWGLCDGTGGTPDLRNRFPRSVLWDEEPLEEPGETGGSTTHDHVVDPPPTLTGQASGDVARGIGVSNIPHENHWHNVNIPPFNSGSGSSLPPYYKLAFIMKLPAPTDVVDEGVKGPGARRLVLHPAFPNPFNPTTTIRYEIGRPAHVTVRIYDVSGALVTVMEDRPRPAGHHEITWDGKNARGQTVASGIYSYRVTAMGMTQTRKMVLLK